MNRSVIQLVSHPNVDIPMYACTVPNCCLPDCQRTTIWLGQRMITEHIANHRRDIQKLATHLLADKQSPFHLFDEYILRQILMHSVSPIF